VLGPLWTRDCNLAIAHKPRRPLCSTPPLTLSAPPLTPRGLHCPPRTTPPGAQPRRPTVGGLQPLLIGSWNQDRRRCSGTSAFPAWHTHGAAGLHSRQHPISSVTGFPQVRAPSVILTALLGRADSKDTWNRWKEPVRKRTLASHHLAPSTLHPFATMHPFDSSQLRQLYISTGGDSTSSQGGNTLGGRQAARAESPPLLQLEASCHVKFHDGLRVQQGRRGSC